MPQVSSVIQRLARLVLGVLLLCVLGVAWYGQHELQFGNPRLRGAWILLGAMAAVAGLMALIYWLTRVGPERGRANASGAFEVSTSSTLEWMAVAALFVIGVVYRCIHFSTIPAGMNHDSAWYGMYAIHITQGAEYTPYISAAWGRETLFMYMIAPFVYWLGNVPEAIQITSTLCGIVALVPIYILGRTVFNGRIGLIALAFLAVSGWHGLFSRAGWRVITVTPFEILALYGTWRAVHSDRRRYWILMGAGAALSIYTYNAARIVPVIVGLYYLICFPRQRERRRRYLLGGALALLTFILVGLPMLWYAATHFQQFQGRADFLLQEREERGSMLSNWWNALRLFNYRGNGDDFFIQEPLLEPLAAVLFLVGSVVALSRVRRREYAFLVIGLLVSLVPGVLSVPNANRCITAVPFVYLLIAVGLDMIVRQVAALLPRRWSVAVPAALITVAVLFAAYESYDEFIGPRRRAVHGFNPGATAAGLFMHKYSGRYKPYTISSWPEYTLIYLGYPGTGDPFQRNFAYGHSLSEVEGEIDRHGAKGLLFLLDFTPEANDALTQLTRRFAENRIEPLLPPREGGEPVGRALFVEPAGLSTSGLWSNFSRALFLHRGPGAQPALQATRCGPTLGDATGVSTRVRLMMPALGKPMDVAQVRFVRNCPAGAAHPPLLTVAINDTGLVATADQEAALVPWAKLEAGRWYDIYALVGTHDHTARIVVEGLPTPVTTSLAVDPKLPVQVSGFEVIADHVQDAGGEFYVDDLTVLNGMLQPRNDRWMAAKRPEDTPVLEENFDAKPFGALAAKDGWQDIVGSLAVADSPREREDTETAQQGMNAFDGGNGSRPGQFDEPMGLAVDPAGNFYITERVGNRVQKFAADGSYVASWGKPGNGHGEFREPMDAAGDDQFLYVADTWNHRVQIFDWNGTFIFEFKGDPPLSSPRGIDARQGKIYLADSGRGVVRVFDQSGKQLLSMGQNGGSEPGHLIEPVDVAVDAAGRVYVVNSGNNRIEIFNPDGQPAGSFPVAGWEGGGLKEGYLTIAADDLIYLSDPVAGRVRRFKSDGTELPAIEARIDSPSGLRFAGQRLLVSARRAHRIRAIDQEEAAGTTAAAGR